MKKINIGVDKAVTFKYDDTVYTRNIVIGEVDIEGLQDFLIAQTVIRYGQSIWKDKEGTKTAPPMETIDVTQYLSEYRRQGTLTPEEKQKRELKKQGLTDEQAESLVKQMIQMKQENTKG